MAEKRIFSIFVDLDLNLCKASRVHAFSPRARASLRGSLCLVGGEVLSYEHKFQIS